MIYGCLYELGKNKEFYYKSGFGSKYSHIHDDAKDNCIKIFEDFVDKILNAEEEIYKDRKRHDTFSDLKNSNNA